MKDYKNEEVIEKVSYGGMMDETARDSEGDKMRLPACCETRRGRNA